MSPFVHCKGVSQHEHRRSCHPIEVDNFDQIALQAINLDDRFGRVDNDRVEWYDLDLPAVIDLRRQFYPDRARCHLIASSGTDLDLTNAMTAKDRSVLIVAEGLLMYLNEAHVKRLFLRLREVFPGCQLIADVFSRLTARSATRHTSLKQTGASIG